MELGPLSLSVLYTIICVLSTIANILILCGLGATRQLTRRFSSFVLLNLVILYSAHMVIEFTIVWMVYPVDQYCLPAHIVQHITFGEVVLVIMLVCDWCRRARRGGSEQERNRDRERGLNISRKGMFAVCLVYVYILLLAGMSYWLGELLFWYEICPDMLGVGQFFAYVIQHALLVVFVIGAHCCCCCRCAVGSETDDARARVDKLELYIADAFTACWTPLVLVYVLRMERFHLSGPLAAKAVAKSYPIFAFYFLYLYRAEFRGALKRCFWPYFGKEYRDATFPLEQGSSSPPCY